MNDRNTSLSPVYSAPVPKIGPIKAKNLNGMNDSAKTVSMFDWSREVQPMLTYAEWGP